MTEQSGNMPTVEYMLTTVDNPFDPFDQFKEWLAYDHRLGYDTPGLLAYVTYTSDELSEIDQLIAVQDAIDEVVKENVMGVHRKVKRGQLASLNGE